MGSLKEPYQWDGSSKYKQYIDPTDMALFSNHTKAIIEELGG